MAYLLSLYLIAAWSCAGIGFWPDKPAAYPKLHRKPDDLQQCRVGAVSSIYGILSAQELGFWPDKPAAYPQLNVKTDAELKALPAAAGGPPAQPLPASSPLPPLPAETGTDAAQAPAVGTETEVETHVQQAAEAKADATTQTQPAAGPAAAQDLAGDITADSSMAGIEALISTLSSAAGTAVVAGSSSDGPVSPDRKAPETREDSTER